MPSIVSQSNDHKNDRLLGPQGLCGHAPAGLAQDRCGYGPRVPMLVISPYAKTNFIDHSLPIRHLSCALSKTIGD